jgi:hypothetical protein
MVVGEATLAVNVTVWPCAEGFSDEVIVVRVTAGWTVCGNTADVLVADCASPL